MTIAVAKDLKSFLAEQVRAGHGEEASAPVNDVLRLLRDQRQALFQVTPELKNWLLETAESPAWPLLRPDFMSIRERVKNRIKPENP